MILLALALIAAPALDPQAKAAIDRYDKAYAEMKTLQYKFKKQERMRDGTVIREEAFCKFRKPGDVYLAALKPKVGQEVIYRPSVEKNKLTVHPGSFPDVTLNLDVHGSLTTKNQHHPVYHTDFGYGLSVLKRALGENGAGQNGEKAEYKGIETRNGRKAEIVLLTVGNKPPKRVAANKGESVFSFAKRVGQDAYIIFDANESIGALSDKLDEGETYVVPAYYGEKTEMAIDLETGFLVSQTVYNGDGEIYEKFEYSEMVVNPPLTDLDFDPKNPAYKF